MRRGPLLAAALVLALVLSFLAGTQFGSDETSAAATTPAPGTPDCGVDGSEATEPAGDAPTTEPPAGIVYDPDGAGPGQPQEPLDGYDPLNPTGPAGGPAPVSDQPGRHVLIYDPFGTQQGDTYTVFADLVAAAATVRGGGTIYIPHDAIIDAPGTYDLNHFGFASNGSTTGFAKTILTIPDGVTFENPGYFIAQAGLVLYSTSRAPVVTVRAESYESSRMFLLENDGFVASKTAPFFDLTAVSTTSFVFISMRHGGGIAKPSDLGIPGGDHESVLANAGDGFVVLADVAPPLGFHDGTVRGEGGIVWNRYTTAVPTPGTSVTRGLSQPNAETFAAHVLSSTALSTHQQADPEAWISPDGSTTAASLDELACRLAALEGREGP